jgi:hypothetical protein
MHLSLDLIACHMTKRNYNQHPSSRGHPHMSRWDSLDIYVSRAMEIVPRTNHVSWNTAHWGHPLSAMLEFARHLCRTGHWNRHQDKPYIYVLKFHIILPEINEKSKWNWQDVYHLKQCIFICLSAATTNQY